jgi:radical SAM protein with 4Fe4S-binding SPASM domain
MNRESQMANGESSADRPLRLLFWESTARCNLACVHCRRLDVAEEATKDDLTTEEVRAVLDSAATLGRPIVVFSGGEPLMRSDWEALAGHAKRLGLPTALATNGTLIDFAIARRIAKAGFHRVSVSLDGADALTHDAFRGLDGAFDRAIAGVVELRDAGIPFQINATVAGHNVDQLPQIYALARSLGAKALHLFLLVPVGCGVQIARTHQLAPALYEEVLQWVCDRQGGPLELKATCAPHYQRVAAQRGMDYKRSRGCLAGTAVCFVSHKGEVFPCGYLPVRCGSVRDKPLADVWRDSPVLAELRDFARLKGKCGACTFKAFCGGCRARAYSATGDYLAEEPACAYTPPNRTSRPTTDQ